MRGHLHSQRGEYDQAIQDLSQAIRLDPQSAFPYVNRGVAYDETGKHDLAIADLTEAIRLDPRLPKAKAEADFAKAKELGYEPE
jgi:tetratricopeptide (TPR) repeat protein